MLGALGPRWPALLTQRSLAPVDLTSRELREAADTLRIQLPEPPAPPGNDRASRTPW
jgi:hypothetical protein